MAKIVYGVAGEGFGHSSRSELIGKRLIAAGHKVVFAASRKSLAYLHPTFDSQVREVYGLSFYYQSGSVRPARTVLKNLCGLPKGMAINKDVFTEFGTRFRPDLVISDFEPFSAWWAWRNRIPCVSIDHEHLLTCCEIEPDASSWKERTMAKLVTRAYHTFADAYVILNFFKTPVLNKATRVVPPVVRQSVLQNESVRDKHILVYSTDCGDDMRNHILNTLSPFKSHQFRIYGFNIVKQIGNCQFKLASTKNFLGDLAACRGVIATAGFSLLSECLHFRKPMLLMPLRDQYEQAINAFYVEKLGMGQQTKQLTHEDFGDFLNRLDTFTFDHSLLMMPDNNAFFEKLDDTFRTIGFNLQLAAAG